MRCLRRRVEKLELLTANASRPLGDMFREIEERAIRALTAHERRLFEPLLGRNCRPSNLGRDEKTALNKWEQAFTAAAATLLPGYSVGDRWL